MRHGRRGVNQPNEGGGLAAAVGPPSFGGCQWQRPAAAWPRTASSGAQGRPAAGATHGGARAGLPQIGSALLTRGHPPFECAHPHPHPHAPALAWLKDPGPPDSGCGSGWVSTLVNAVALAWATAWPWPRDWALRRQRGERRIPFEIQPGCRNLRQPQTTSGMRLCATFTEPSAHCAKAVAMAVPVACPWPWLMALAKLHGGWCGWQRRRPT